ncbi:hypothetical protein ACMC56_13230 [Campylobacterota bacterium DY0563]
MSNEEPKRNYENVIIEFIKLLKIPILFLSIYILFSIIDIEELINNINKYVKKSNIQTIETPYFKIKYIKEEIKKAKDLLTNIDNKNILKRNDLKKSLNELELLLKPFDKLRQNECYVILMDEKELYKHLDIKKYDKISFDTSFFIDKTFNIKTPINDLVSCYHDISINTKLEKGNNIRILDFLRTQSFIPNKYLIKFRIVDNLNSPFN